MYVIYYIYVSPHDALLSYTLLSYTPIEEEEEEEIPEDLVDLSPEEQQSHIKWRAFMGLLAGTVICFIVSDPMVDVFTEVSARLNINSFYVTFLFAPLASNATELIAAYIYAKKKTSKSITISFSTLLGAACLNNTFSLGMLSMWNPLCLVPVALSYYNILFYPIYRNFSWYYLPKEHSIDLFR